MKFDIDINKEDFLHFNNYTIQRMHNTSDMEWKITLFNILYWVLFALFLVTLYLAYKQADSAHSMHILKIVIAFGVWFAIASAWGSIYKKLYLSAIADDKGTIQGKWHIELSESGITESSALCTHVFKWQCIQSVEQDEHNMYLFTDPVKAIILPLRHMNADIENEIKKHTQGKYKGVSDDASF